MEAVCAVALILPSTAAESARVASATDGAAPNSPAKLFGLNRSPSSANVETDSPPMMKRIRISFMAPEKGPPEYVQGCNSLSQLAPACQFSRGGSCPLQLEEKRM